MSDMDDDNNTQLVCESQPSCLCTGDNACDCTAGEAPLDTVCSGCEAVMVRIDRDTGEAVVNG